MESMKANIFEAYIDTIEATGVNISDIKPQWYWEQQWADDSDGEMWVARAMHNAGRSAMIYETATGYRASLCVMFPDYSAAAPGNALTLEMALAHEGDAFRTAAEAMRWVEEQAWRLIKRMGELYAQTEVLPESLPHNGARLLVQRKDGSRHELTWEQSIITVGRGRDNDIVIDHPMASRRHASIERRREGVFITDLGSTNGTYVNGKPVYGEYRLCNQDEVIIGDTLIIYDEQTSVSRAA